VSSLAKRTTIWLGAGERESVPGYADIHSEDDMIAIEVIEGNETIEVFIMPSLFPKLRIVLDGLENYG
jgi:hypothetical protein